jgi:hypothetical protein
MELFRNVIYYGHIIAGGDVSRFGPETCLGLCPIELLRQPRKWAGVYG